MNKRNAILYILTGFVLVAVIVTVFIGIPGTRPDTAAVILPETSPQGKKEELIPPEVIEVAPDTVQTVIADMSRAESYSRSICAESFWSGGSTRRNIDVWVKNGNSKLEISRPDGSSTMHVLLKDGQRQIWYSDAYGVFESASAADDADSYQALLSYERILDMNRSAILDAGYENYLGEMCIFVRYVSGELGYENVCYVSLSSGLVIGEESYDDGTLVVRVISTLPDFSEISDSVFETP